MLDYPSEWKFPIDKGPGAIPGEALSFFHGIFLQIASNNQSAIESIKNIFSASIGNSCSRSSDYGWATSDLYEAMEKVAFNAPVFIDALFESIDNLARSGRTVPSVGYINKVLEEKGVPFQINGQSIIRIGGDAYIHNSGFSGVSQQEDDGSGLYYQILEEPIGVGAYGTVYKATRSSSIATFEFALKFLDPSPFVEDKGKAIERFKREIKAIQLLQHRAIISYIDAGIDHNNRPYLVMPLIVGEDFATSARRQSFSTRIRMMCEVLNGLCHAHNSNVLHRDLKPSNIIVRKSDLQPIIVDFGQAYLLENMDSKTLTTSNIGTAGYIPSEVLADPRIRSKQHDIYSCGIMLFEIFVGRKPDPMDLSSLGEVDDRLRCLDVVIGNALAPATRRFQEPEDFMKELYIAGQGLIG